MRNVSMVYLGINLNRQIMKTYTIEAYQYNTDKKTKIRVMVGSINELRDCLTPCMRFVEEVRAKNKANVVKQVRARAKREGFQFVA